jgi:hypothetical protein
MKSKCCLCIQFTHENTSEGTILHHGQQNKFGGGGGKTPPAQKIGVVEGDNTIIYLARWIFGVVEENVAIVKVMWPLIGPILDTYIYQGSSQPFLQVAITANRKLSVFVENMATAGRFAASSEELGKCTYRHTIW